jgi:AraC family transcriptional regulator of adaptative response/methylated-DNA-[protein]-cysteine methyltransferase
MRDAYGGQRPADDDEWRWQAFVARDRTADGRFVAAVRTTGIYCRPSCPSRRPLRDHVEFFESSAAAVRAGYRPCRRCRPERAAAPAAAVVAAARAQIDARPEASWTLVTLADTLGVSPGHLRRLFQRETGLTPRQYVAARRAAALRDGLRAGEAVTAALYRAGYGSSAALYRQSRAALGMRPGDYRRGGAGCAIRYGVAATSLGPLVAAVTDRGLCAVRFVDDAAHAAAELAREFPAAALTPDGAAVAIWLDALVALVEDGAPLAALPLDVRGTAFQLRVWESVRRIPCGETRTYGEIAHMVGRPRAARAVGRACARNPVALAIPCHRVVTATVGESAREGGPERYRWGAQRKRVLLAREGRRAARPAAKPDPDGVQSREQRDGAP